MAQDRFCHKLAGLCTTYLICLFTPRFFRPSSTSVPLYQSCTIWVPCSGSSSKLLGWCKYRLVLPLQSLWSRQVGCSRCQALFQKIVWDVSIFTFLKVGIWLCNGNNTIPGVYASHGWALSHFLANKSFAVIAYMLSCRIFSNSYWCVQSAMKIFLNLFKNHISRNEHVFQTERIIILLVTTTWCD